jgi:hypothetical protein
MKHESIDHFSEMLLKQYGIKPKQQSFMYRTPNPSGYDQIPFPNLLAFAKDTCVSLSKIKNAENLLDFFRLPMSRQAYNELLELQHYLANIALSSENEKDSWSFIWGQQKYSSSKYYNFQFSSIQPNRTVVWIWETKCVPKIKFFAWLLLNDRLNTRNILRRRNKVLEDGYNCVLCHEEAEETLVHLFFDCPSATCR